jgi:hypothetical protein
MLCSIFILGGVLVMMGQRARSQALFYYLRLKDQVPLNAAHLRSTYDPPPQRPAQIVECRR